MALAPAMDISALTPTETIQRSMAPPQTAPRDPQPASHPWPPRSRCSSESPANRGVQGPTAPCRCCCSPTARRNQAPQWPPASLHHGKLGEMSCGFLAFTRTPNQAASCSPSASISTRLGADCFPRPRNPCGLSGRPETPAPTTLYPQTSASSAHPVPKPHPRSDHIPGVHPRFGVRLGGQAGIT